MAKRLQLDGQRFGRWLVLRTERDKNNKSLCVCLCDCGNYKNVSAYELKRGGSKSCGCFARELLSLRQRKHGMCYTPAYKAWYRMIRRCNSSKSDKWKDYGGRGITVCQKWHNFEAFYADMGEPPTGKTLDRIDCNGNYSPENCRWSDARTQTRNRRISINVEFQGQVKPLQVWADEKGLRYDTLWKRLKIRGWSVEKALTVKEGRGRNYGFRA